MTGSLPPGVEICNGLDDDCDGDVDAPPASMCPVSTLNEPGVCLGELGCTTFQGCDTFQDCAIVNPGADCDPATRLCTIQL